jgi:hypothetical protein
MCIWFNTYRNIRDDNFDKSPDLLIAISLYNFASKNPAKPCMVPVVGIVNSTSPYLELSIGAKQLKSNYRDKKIVLFLLEKLGCSKVNNGLVSAKKKQLCK